ncbi:MAG: prepilin-type N-terminal cleavage/methylation domain-containing protein [candidate division KSB1 bacterium]|nr:prepilin-type N-terminal cleavage/methylation domain-containing protein [candidate division KSB1 bacterium]
MGNEKGFTLLEVLVSVSLLTIGVVSLLSFYSQSSQFHVRQRLLAFQLAMERIEAIRQVVLEKGGAAVSPTAYPDDQVLNSTLFLRKTRIHKISDRLLEVTVTVIYPNGRVQLTTRLLQWQN